MTIQKPEPLPMYKFLVTCETTNCFNQGVSITAEAPVEDIAAVCGVCGEEINEILLSSTPSEK
jgi:formylmethanofuran dehydrogenase subunit E